MSCEKSALVVGSGPLLLKKPQGNSRAFAFGVPRDSLFVPFAHLISAYL